MGIRDPARVALGSGISSRLRSATNSRIRALLRQQGFVLLDGGLGTALDHGEAQRHMLWGAHLLLDKSSGHSKIVKAHKEFLDAGADIICTNSYKVSYEIFEASGLFDGAFPELLADPLPQESQREHFSRALLIASVRLGKETRDAWCAASQVPAPGPLVAASVGPAADNLQTFVGATDPNTTVTGNAALEEFDIEQYYSRKLHALVAAGPDLIALETLPSRREAEIAVTALRNVSPAMPCWVSFICTSEQAVSGGDPFVECVEALGS